MRHTDGPAEPTQRLRRILLAEDDDAQRAGLCDFLELSGYDVCAVASGTDLLDMLALVADGLAARPDLIITDIHMPGIPGLNVAEELRAVGWEEPIIVISGFAGGRGVADRIDELDDTWIMAKPFEPTRLAELVFELTQ